MSILTPVTARVWSMPEKLGSGEFFLTKGRAQTLQEMITAGLPTRMQSRWNIILNADNAHDPDPLDPFLTPPHYEDEEGADAAIAKIRADMEPAVDLAIRWKMLRDPADAEAVVRILTAWARIGTFNVTNNERLNWANKWTLGIQAAILIRDSPAYTPGFDEEIKNVSLYTLNLYQPEFTMTDNRNMWGTAYRMAVAALTGDRALLYSAIQAWQFSMNDSLVDDVLVHEIYREGSTVGNGSTGLHYCNYYLSAAVTAAEIARFAGEWLYDYATPDGSTLKGCWDLVSYWSANPAEYPYNTSGTPSSTNRIYSHVDPLHALWPNEDSEYLIGAFNPTQDYYGLRHNVLAYRGRPLWG